MPLRLTGLGSSVFHTAFGDAEAAVGTGTSEEEVEKECNFNDFMLGNNASKWSPLKSDIKWAYDHSMHGKEIHAWWPGHAAKGECNDLSDKSRGCWYRSRMLGDPACLVENRCLHFAGHEGEPTHTYTCPTWLKDEDGSSCKLPLGWQACPPKFHMARVDEGVPQSLKQARTQNCNLSDGEKLFLGRWREVNTTIRYTVKKTDMAQLQVVVETNGQQAPPPLPGAPPLPLEPTASQLLREGRPPSEHVPGQGLAAAKAELEKGKLEKVEEEPGEEKLTGNLVLEGEWMRAKLHDEHDQPTGSEVEMQIDERGNLMARFKSGADVNWGPAVEAVRDIRTEGGTANGASCLFPFAYKGMAYHDCTTADESRPWCRTDIQGNWGYCKDQVPHEQPQVIGTHGGDFESAGPKCMFPFTHNSSVYKTCKMIPDLAKDGLVCQTDSDGSWGYCNCKVKKEPGGDVQTHGGTAKGAKCKFPFTYEGKEYSACHDFGDGAPACLTDDKGTWGYCNCSRPLHLLGPGGFDPEDKTASAQDHCLGSTEGKVDANMIFDIRHNEWFRCTDKFRCEPFDIRAIHDAAEGECGKGHRCTKDELCLEHRVTSKRSTFECVPHTRILVLPDGDDVAKFAAPGPLFVLALPASVRGARGGGQRRRMGRFL